MIRLALILTLVVANLSVQAAEPEILHCSDFGCKTKTPLTFSPQQWQRLSGLFARPTLSAWLEKQRIRQAIALMEQFSGQISGTHHDRGGNYPGKDLPHQMDCIDESTNTLQFLWALQQRQLLHWHRVDGKLRRRTWFIFGHWTAVIQQVNTGQRYAVDSWHEDNGKAPYIQEINAWINNHDFAQAINPLVVEL